jgi:hypothetical protein
MIITFSKRRLESGAWGPEEYISVDGERPIVQDNKSCHSMHDHCPLYGGSMSVSDEPVEGWAVAEMHADHIYFHIKGYGSVGAGAIVFEVFDAIKFKYKGKMWWSAANNFHKMTPEEVREFWKRRQSDAKDRIKASEAYLAGLYPVELPKPPPPPVKKGRARKGEAIFTLS